MNTTHTATETTLPTIKGAWDTDKVVRVLGNAMARAAMSGKAQPMAELALARLTGTSEAR